MKTLNLASGYQLCKRLAAACVLIFGTCLSPALAENYPSRTVIFVVPFSAGSITDTVARWIANDLQHTLNGTFIVENKPGAQGLVAGNYVARAAPDGYTLFFTTNTTQSAAPGLFKKVPYDPIKDFVPIARVAGFPSFIAVNPSSKIKSIAELVAYAKANPGKLSAGYGNSSGRVAIETFKKRLGLDIASVPYRGNPAAINDLIGGHTFIAVPDFGTGMPQVLANTIRPLAVLTNERNDALPDVPTLSETVMPGFDLLAWAGIFGPAGTPPEVVNTLAKAVERSVTKPEFKKQFSALGIDVFWAGPEQFDKYERSELVKWTGMIKEAGIEPE
jgi:tripartite-type tricarboxylate transporter receptor subunit TctC